VIVYADTSALAKLILDEDGTPKMGALASAADVVATAAIAYVELRAALAAAIGDGRVPIPGRDRLVLTFERVWQRVSEIAIDTPLLRDAGDLAEQMRLRGYDAVHLAALRALGDPGEVTFACWDQDLSRAARELGYELVAS
jgi:uncharacterized protein